jgi:two-component system response regulator
MQPILIVDDSADDRLFAQRVFRESRILNPIIGLGGGQRCLDYFTDIRAKDIPALVLIDLAMPRPDGVEVLHELNDAGWGAKTVFVMLSALEDIKHIRAGYQAGARTFLIKPLTRDHCLQMVRDIHQIGVASELDGFILTAQPLATV